VSVYFVKEGISMPIPEEIVKGVKSGKCILFLGAMASAALPEGSRFKYEKAPQVAQNFPDDWQSDADT
jgi:hypothetical protein